MKKLYLVVALSLVAFLVIRCRHREKTVVERVTITTTEDDPGPPPNSVINSKPITLKEWFFKLCDEHGDVKTMVSYKFDFWETGDFYQIGLIDLGKLGKDVRQYYEQKNIKPQGKFFAIPKTDYRDLKWQQVLDKIKTQLKAYCQTDKFKQSYLAKAKSVTVRFDDNEVINLK